jgi:hypothetical protein
MKGLDWGWGAPSPAAIKAAGFEFVLRYLAPLPNSKVITKDEIQRYIDNDIGIGLVWEADQYRPLKGASIGLADGIEARRQARALNFPDNIPLFGAVDFNPNASQYPAIHDYLARGYFEPYSNAYVMRYLNPAHSWLMDWDGVSNADAHLALWPTAHLHQHGGQVTINNVQCDVNDCFSPDCLWFPNRGKSMPIAPQFSPPLSIVAWTLFTHSIYGYCIAAAGKDGAVFCDPPNAYFGGANGKDYFKNREVADILPTAAGYKLIDTQNEEYNYP